MHRLFYGLTGILILCAVELYFQPPIDRTSPKTLSTPTSTIPAALIPVSNREPIREFQLLDPATKSYQLDARRSWEEQKLDIVAVPNAHIYIQTDPTYKVCSDLRSPCADAGGISGMAGSDALYPTLYAFGGARYYSLIGRWGNNGRPFPIGINYDGTIPEDAVGELQVMANVTTPPDHLSANTGGHRITEIAIRP